MAKITILGIGNILIQDEGFGVHVIEEILNKYTFLPNVQVLDGGNLGMGLLTFLDGTDKLIIVDAVSGGEAPGTLYRFEKDDVLAYFKQKISIHELGIQEILATLEFLGRPIKEIIVVGVQPLSLDVGLELTPLVAEKVTPIIDEILTKLAEWDVEAVKNG